MCSIVEQLKKYWVGGYFVWWVTQQDCEKITSLQLRSLPEYILLELDSRKGRSGRGRLWVSPNMGLPTKTNNVPNNIGDIGGIVIRGVDRKYLPVDVGKLTKM